MQSNQLKLFCFILFCGVLLGQTNTNYNATVLFEWQTFDSEYLQRSFVNFTFPSSWQYNYYIDNNIYNQTIVTGVAVSKKTGRIFVGMPRWNANIKAKTYIPGTLNEIKDLSTQHNPLLSPYPSFKLNEVAYQGLYYWKKNYLIKGYGYTSDALQSVLGFQIDDDDILWALDQAHAGGAAGMFVQGTIKLVQIDLSTDTIINVYRFPEEIAGPTSMLNDLRIDKKGGFVYITDSGIFVQGNQTLTGAIIVLDMNQTPYKARRLFSGWNITINDPQFWLTIDNEKVLKSTPMRTGADGIALSPQKDMLVVCPLSSHLIWKVETKYLKNFSISEEYIYNKVQFMGNRSFASDGLVFDSNGDLILGSLEGSAVIKLSSSLNFDQAGSSQIMYQDKTLSGWPDTFSWDANGNLYYTADQLWKIENSDFNFTDFNEIKYRIIKIANATAFE